MGGASANWEGEGSVEGPHRAAGALNCVELEAPIIGVVCQMRCR